MNWRLSKGGLAVGCVLFLASCSLPRGAAMQAELLSKDSIQQADLAVYSVGRDLLPKIVKWPRTGGVRSDGWIARHPGPKSTVIKPGDWLNLSIWDSETNSLLTAPDQKNININEVQVAPDGTIFVPYIDRIYVTGMSPAKAREVIETQLENIITSAQVQLTQVAGRLNAVDLVGGVAKAGNYPLPDRDFTVLSLLSSGGGVTSGIRNPQVRLVRGPKVYVTSLARLYANPSLDTTLRGGDKVIIDEDKRYFLALGATGRERLNYFQKDRITALEALSIVGGVSDSKADPKGVLVLRDYPASAVRADGKSGPSKQRVVFTIDLTSADGLFSAGHFQIYPKDLVLATDSPLNSARTVISLISSLRTFKRF